nr:uncharacterized protein LOC123765367 [Procambarus clarkii]
MACVVSTLLYGSEFSTLRARQEKQLNVFHTRNLRRILDITWRDHVTNNAVLQRTEILSMFTLLKQRRMRWLGLITLIEDSRISKVLLYGELVSGKRPTGRPQLHFRYACKCDLKQPNINT